jgi:DNA invertase Pin-like site-specific DNA recombinase
MDMEMKRVGIYARVSTKDQTTENQLLDLRKYCEARGWHIAAECIDNGISGTKDDRPQLKAVMELARKRKIDILLVWRFDRFARSLANLVNSLEELRGLGVDFASFQENIDTTSAQGKMLFGIFASIAEFERALIVERVLAGLRRAKAQGKRLGRPLVVRDNSQALNLKAGGLSIREIAAKLGTSKSSVARMLSQQSPARIA